MATAPKSVTSLDQRRPECSNGQTDRRQNVLIGDLPEDFLRIEPTVEQKQVAADEQAALAIHHMQYARPVGVPAVASGVSLPNVRGRLDITVVEARLVKNYGVTRMDPYVRLRVGHHVYETKTSYNGAKNPKWEKVFHCFLPHGVDSLHLEIYDERAFSSDEKIAWALHSIPDTVLEGQTVEEWVPLNGKQGDGEEGSICIVMTFTTMPNQPMYQQTPYLIPAPVGLANSSPPGPVHVQQQLPAVAQISAEDVKQLQEMFPGLEEDVIRTILENERGNKDRAINSLLQMTE